MPANLWSSGLTTFRQIGSSASGRCASTTEAARATAVALGDVTRRIVVGSFSKSKSRAPDEQSRYALQDAWRRSRSGLAVVVLLTAFINILKLTLPLFIFQLLDRVIASRSVDTLILLTGIALMALAFAAVAESLRRWMLSHWGTWISQHFGHRLFISGVNPGRARGPARSLEDLSTVSGFVSGSGVTAWLDVVWAPAFLLIAFMIHPMIGLVVLAGMLAMIVLGALNEFATRRMRRAARSARKRSDKLVATAERHIETVAGLNITDRLADRWLRTLAKQGHETLASRVTSQAIGETMRFAESVQRVACYALGVWLAISNEISVGAIIAGAVLGRIGTSIVRRAMGNWRQLVLARRSLLRIERRLTASRRGRHAVRDPDKRMALKLDEVTHVYNQWSQPVLRQINVEVAPGEMLCVLGASGTGKSTLARLVSGIVQPTMGRVRLGDLDLTRFSESDRRRLIGYHQQTTTLLEGTIAENICRLSAAEDRDIVEAARLAIVHDVVNALPKGYETRVGTQNVALSGGEIRRIGVARALFGRPHLIVLDEPEANLDDALVAALVGTLASCKAWGSVLVVASQSARLASAADKVLVLGRSPVPLYFDTREAFAHWQAKVGATIAAETDPAPNAAFAGNLAS